MLPFIEVSHLPSSSSFYSTISQALGLRYMSTADHALSPSGPPSITYGSGTSPLTAVFELRQVKPTSERPLKLSRVKFSAASPSVVRHFQQRVTEADGRVFPDDVRSPLALFAGPASPANTEDWSLPVKATGTDLDGNTMDVVYIPPPTYPEAFYDTTIRKTSSSEGEISRIMTWNYDVAASDASPGMAMTPFLPAPTSSSSTFTKLGASPEDDAMPVLRRTITTTSTTYLPTGPAPSPQQQSGGLTTGLLLGVAAASAAIGAGIAYGAMKHDRLRSGVEPPLFQRRSTFPEPLGARSHYSEHGASRDYQPVAGRRPPPTVSTRYSHSQSAREGDSPSLEDSLGRLSSRVKPLGTPSVRTHSEASSSRRPLLLMDVEHGSYVSSGSKHSARTSEMEEVMNGSRSRATSSKSQYTEVAAQAPAMRRSSTYDDGGTEQGSYVSSRSQRSASTVRGPGKMQATAQTEVSLASRPKMAGSRVSRRADSYTSAREGPASRVSARRIELPMSGVGSSRAGYEREDDLCSIAPSDSISCIGSSRKGSRA